MRSASRPVTKLVNTVTKNIHIFKNVIFFYSVRFINVWVGKKSILSSIILISNPLGAFKDIKISAQSVGGTHHKTFLILLIRLNVLILNHVITIKKA